MCGFGTKKQRVMQTQLRVKVENGKQKEAEKMQRAS